MQLFERKFKWFTYAVIGLIYDIIGTIFIALFYHPTIVYRGMTVGNLNAVLDNPDRRWLYYGLITIILGFVCLLVDQFIDIYKIRNNISKFFLIILSLPLVLLLVLVFFVMILVLLFLIFSALIAHSIFFICVIAIFSIICLVYYYHNQVY
ncbi:MAG: hypothetical protein COT80_03890 [Candidatus Buchananbacteria bacterium CG10_big_fil_rev_8_21_14_0_10_33_19]|uniref:Uncharacterized protein n=1 Tax=Candidatus Buchananbacteria bacterium CG10_big_fil_rev_8_21_14_0_10_33_19 TaxID=1974525 RepID=A0A2H0W3E5_9BACT|nr:MAG: hypothetical protein COT80_03890 [Candidatus Buchananbacteria bacterium CG10_big_fil_rev_8_21_14_0_10_33_19]